MSNSGAYIKWHRVIKNDKSKLFDFLQYFEDELEVAKTEVKAQGVIETVAKNIPYYHDMRFGQLQQIETVLETLEIELKQIHSEKFKMYLEGYKRTLSSSDCMKYVQGDADVVAQCELINEVKHIRNMFLGVVSSLEKLGFAIGHIVKLRTAGIEDAKF